MVKIIFIFFLILQVLSLDSTNSSNKTTEGQKHQIKKYTKLKTIYFSNKSENNFDSLWNILTFSIKDQKYEKKEKDLSRKKRESIGPSKFTGDVLGAESNPQLQGKVKAKLQAIQNSIWTLQAQITQPYKDEESPATIRGAFSSTVITNFHGPPSISSLRHSNKYTTTDFNFVATSMILHCLVDAVMLGKNIQLSTSNMSLAVNALSEFYTHSDTNHSNGGLVVLWPERNQDNKWVSYSDNLIKSTEYSESSFDKMLNVKKSCKCKALDSTIDQITDSKYCKRYMNTTLPRLLMTRPTPPDVLSTMSNLALGAIFKSTMPSKDGKRQTLFQAELINWNSQNANISNIFKQIKKTVLLYKRQNKLVDKNINKYSNIHLERVGASRKLEDKPNNKNNEINENTNKEKQVQNEDSKDPNNISKLKNSKRKEKLKSEKKSRKSKQINSNQEGSDIQKQKLNKSKTVNKNVNDNSNEISQNDEIKNEKTKVDNSNKVSKNKKPENKIINTDVQNNSIKQRRKRYSEREPLETSNKEINNAKPMLNAISYFTVRKYLDTAFSEENSVALILPLWITHQDNERSGDPSQPNGLLKLGYNHIDMTGIAVTLHSLTSGTIAGLIDLKQDRDTQDIFKSCLQVITWFLKRKKELKIVLNASVFPSKLQFYWKLARSGFLLSREHMVFQDIAVIERESFLESLRHEMTLDILGHITDGGVDASGKTMVYVDDILGASDLDTDGKKKVSSDDRLFNSAMAVNTLMSTWTTNRANGDLIFINSTSDAVRIAVNSLVNFVYSNVLNDKLRKDQVLMTETIKNCQMLPNLFPSNIPGYGVSGYIKKDKYNETYKKMKEKSNKHKREDDKDRINNFLDLNGPTSVFRLWSSEAYTQSACFLAIAHAANIKLTDSSL